MTMLEPRSGVADIGHRHVEYSLDNTQISIPVLKVKW